MTIIKLETRIAAPIERCFDLARSLDLHKDSMKESGEKAVAGKISGLLEQGETVTWQARHFGVLQKLTTLMTKVEHPFFFEDKMLKGAFRKMEHQHIFRTEGKVTLMIDEFHYDVPAGFLGRLFDKLVLKNYMQQILQTRNEVIKRTAESEDWKKFLTLN
jgi:Uncharacterized conserved protein